MSHAKNALWDSGHDESVEVNQRALIDKVLARYSAEFTVFRELLQNSDDAQSKAVEIRFETKRYVDAQQSAEGAPVSARTEAHELPDLQTTIVDQWTFKNNGMFFRDEDWSRLKKIAEGNPEEEKIGAFGVGFYSLFSVTEEPFVTSGGEWMGFYWKDKKDQLFARRGKIPPTSLPSAWTSFEMPLREPAPIPSAFELTRFLASSLTFMAYLTEVSLYFDDIRLTRLTKASGVTNSLSIPGSLKGFSRMGVMNVKKIYSTPMPMKAEVMRWVYSTGTSKPAVPQPTKRSGFFSSLSLFGIATPQRVPTPLPPVKTAELLEIRETNVTLTIFSAEVDVKLDKKMTTELYRSTKKNPPSKLKYELIYTAKDEYDASLEEDARHPFATGTVFQGLRADLNGSGKNSRVFIGHSTAQTTGLAGHMSSRFIPTVERESIDLVDRNVAVWNRELLYVGGFLSRAAYELEMTDIRKRWEGADPSSPASAHAELRSWLQGRALHCLKFFTFHASTPSPEVSILLQDAFFTCSTNRLFPILSTAGVRNAVDVRLPDSTLSGFVKDVPTLSSEVLTQAASMISALQTRDIIRAMDFEDVLRELRARPLSEVEMVACLSWWIALHQQGKTPNILEIRAKLLQAGIMSVGTQGGSDEKIIPLASISKFINTRSMGSLIPIDGPIPIHVLPHNISRNLPPDALTAVFPWTEFTIIDWLKHVAHPATQHSDPANDLRLSAPWAERVLSVLTRAWPSMSREMQDEAVPLLQGVPCIPTSQGLRNPEQAYFSNVNLFTDLPIVTLPSGTPVKGPLEKVLQALGVRKHVDLQLVFDRMIKTGDWTISDLTKYLVSVQDRLDPLEINRLQLTPAFTAENFPVDQTKGQRRPRYRAGDLYEPLDIHRQLRLPIIDWGAQTKWHGSSPEAKFLFRLGLRRFPPLEVIINAAASSDAAIRGIAFKYLLDSLPQRYSEYDPATFSDIAFVPALYGNEARMGAPKEVFTSPEWSSLGFLIVQPAFQLEASIKLKIPEHPPPHMLVSLLQKTPPQSEEQAREWFAILAKRVANFSKTDLITLSSSPFVPVKGVELRWLPPKQCYFAGGSQVSFHSKLFVFVDFGHQANSFLSACGMNQQPSVEEIALTLLRDPQQFWQMAQGPENYLTELRNIAVNRRMISFPTFQKMKKAPILLGSQRVSHSGGKGSPQKLASMDFDEEDWELQYDLRKPDEIVIADDSIGYQLFGDSILSAPQEDLLETLYAELGSPRLSILVKEEYTTSKELDNSKLSVETRSLILQRLPLFLHGHTHSRPRVTFNWLNDGHHFIVKTFAQVFVTKSLSLKATRLSRKQDASATAKWSGDNSIQLWLAAHTQIDMYEVATSLCRLLFESPKANDALLFMTILSTDLAALKRRGYNVERILRQQRDEREVAQKIARAQVETHTLMSKPSSISVASSSQSLHTRSSGTVVEPIPNTPDRLVSSGSKEQASPFVNSLKNITRKIQDVHQSPPSMHTGGSLPLAKPPPMHTGGSLPLAKPPANPAITPLNDIAKNVDQAISACTETKGHLIRNREQMHMISESLNDSYCDVTGHPTDLNLVGEIGQFKIFVSKGTTNPELILSSKKDMIARFIYVVLPLAALYRLPTTSLNIFYDPTGSCIAFNLKASIFLNLRFFEAWHDEEVQHENLSTAYISWYFTLAHELAHNLVQPHNSEHEFYFSAICEKHVQGLGKLLASH